MSAAKGTAVVIVIVVAMACLGCAESRFELSSESRIPKWFTLPAGLTRADVKVTLEYRSGPFGRKAHLRFLQMGGQRIAALTAEKRGSEPTSLSTSSNGTSFQYPLYEVVTYNGITEVFEHRQMEPVFYVTDDPEVKGRLGVSR